MVEANSLFVACPRCSAWPMAANVTVPNWRTVRKVRKSAKFRLMQGARKKIMAMNKLDDDKKPKAADPSHKPAKHIEETARLASSVEKDKDPGKVRATKD